MEPHAPSLVRPHRGSLVCSPAAGPWLAARHSGGSKHVRPTRGEARLASTDTTVTRRQRTPACSAPTITLHRQIGAEGGIAQPQLLPECIASKGMPHLRPSLARTVGCNASRGPNTYRLGSRGVLLSGTTRFVASLPASPHRLRELSTHMAPVRSVRPATMTLGRQWQQCLLGDTIARPARVVRDPPLA